MKITLCGSFARKPSRESYCTQFFDNIGRFFAYLTSRYIQQLMLSNAFLILTLQTNFATKFEENNYPGDTGDRRNSWLVAAELKCVNTTNLVVSVSKRSQQPIVPADSTRDDSPLRRLCDMRRIFMKADFCIFALESIQLYHAAWRQCLVNDINGQSVALPEDLKILHRWLKQYRRISRVSQRHWFFFCTECADGAVQGRNVHVIPYKLAVFYCRVPKFHLFSIIFILFVEGHGSDGELKREKESKRDDYRK